MVGIVKAPNRTGKHFRRIGNKTKEGKEHGSQTKIHISIVFGQFEATGVFTKTNFCKITCPTL